MEVMAMTVRSNDAMQRSSDGVGTDPVTTSAFDPKRKFAAVAGESSVLTSSGDANLDTKP